MENQLLFQTHNTMATIKIKRKTTTGGSAPTTLGEISCNTADKELFVGDGSSAIKFIDDVAVDAKITAVDTKIDTKITDALTSAFSYKGTVDGNGQVSTAPASNSTVLSASPKKGDFYKVITAGYVKQAGGDGLEAFSSTSFAPTSSATAATVDYGTATNTDGDSYTPVAGFASEYEDEDGNRVTINSTETRYISADGGVNVVMETGLSHLENLELADDGAPFSFTEFNSGEIITIDGVRVYGEFSLSNAGIAGSVTPFFVNINDSVVYNGTSWDKLDNTNSGVRADTGGDIAVTGSTDAGFVVGFSSSATLDQASQTVDGGTYS